MATIKICLFKFGHALTSKENMIKTLGNLKRRGKDPLFG